MSRANSDRAVATRRLGARLALKGITSAVMVVVAPLAVGNLKLAILRAECFYGAFTSTYLTDMSGS
jgi:hypothetical protein